MSMGLIRGEISHLIVTIHNIREISIGLTTICFIARPGEEFYRDRTVWCHGQGEDPTPLPEQLLVVYTFWVIAMDESLEWDSIWQSSFSRFSHVVDCVVWFMAPLQTVFGQQSRAAGDR